MHPDEVERIAWIFGNIALEAGAAIMTARAGDHRASCKSDGSPVTPADLYADDIICTRLAAAFPGISVVSEETLPPRTTTDATGRFILVDPLDGTKEFIEGRDEFTVNICMIENAQPVAGAVYAPALDRLYLAGSSAYSATIRPGAVLPETREMHVLKARERAAKGWRAVVSRSHLDNATRKWIDGHPVTELCAAGSSLKFCVIAEGDADVYPRLAPTMEWDTAAGHAVLLAAGGGVVGLDGTPLGYGKPEYRNGSFVAWGRSSDGLGSNLASGNSDR